LDKHNILESYPFFQKSSRKEQARILRATVLEELAPGRVLQVEGEPCRQFYWLGKGSIRVYKSDSGGKEISLYHVTRGQDCALSAASILTGCPFPAAAQVEESAQAVLINLQDFQELLTESEHFRRHVFMLVGAGIANLIHLVHELAFNNIESRLAWYLYRRFGNNGHTSLMIHETHARIAGELGYSREVVSRQLKEFERDGIIKLDRTRIKLLDAKKLNATAIDSKKSHLCNICYRHTELEKCTFMIT